MGKMSHRTRPTNSAASAPGQLAKRGWDGSPIYDDVVFNPQTHLLEFADVGLMSIYIADCDALATEGSDRPYGRLTAVRALPSACPRVIGHKALRRLFVQTFDDVGVGQIFIAQPSQRRPKKGIPAKEHIAAPVCAPVAAYRRNYARVLRLVDGVPTQCGLNRIHRRALESRRVDRLLVRRSLSLDNHRYFRHAPPFACAHSHRLRQGCGQIRSADW
jgi:hypothetical protein